jgi:V8-like Glu-specific endopeptidase
MKTIWTARLRRAMMWTAAGLVAVPQAYAADIFTLPTVTKDPPRQVIPLPDDEKIVFGTDDRVDTYETSDPRLLTWAASTCGLFPVSRFSQGANGTFSLQPYGTLNELNGIDLCDDQKFGEQPVAASCTGFMVGADLIATAGHCFDESSISDTIFVFGFAMEDEDTAVTSFDANQVYRAVEIVDWALNGALDHAVIRVDRPITAPGAEAFPIRREGTVDVGTQIGIIGHPEGLPQKLVFSEESEVVNNSPEAYFDHVVDSGPGNSGSPLINVTTGEVEGIHVRGSRPVFISRSNCLTWYALPADAADRAGQGSKTTIFAESIPEDGVAEGQFFLRATPTNTLAGDPVVALTWLNPAADTFDRVILVRKLGGFANRPEEGDRLYTGRGQQFLDANVSNGIKYYYTLFVENAEGGVRVSFASALAGDESISALSEGFGTDPLTGLFKPLDLAFAQITFTPVGAPVGSPGSSSATGTYGDYVATVRTDVQNLPVAREDNDGKAQSLRLTEDGVTRVSLGGARFPYFGKLYSTLYLAANGYISFSDLTPIAELNFPSVAAHFAVPRISALFTDLAPSIGGSVWLRGLADRVVVTFENMPEFRVDSPIAPPGGNTFQVELFESGQIRMTYLGLAARDALVGLSDGRGLPVDPATIFQDVEPVDFLVDFTSLPRTVGRLSINPISNPLVEAGETAAFEVTTTTPAGTVDVPVLYAQWSREGAVPFADNGDGTGTFRWDTRVTDNGTVTVRVFAQLAETLTYQDVRVVVGETIVTPGAIDLKLSSNTPEEDPTRNRTVPDDRPLSAQYTYTHPLLSTNPTQYGEGASILYWFRNSALMPAFTNQRSVPAEATHAGDQWQFKVIPVTAGFIAGDEVASPIVTIAGYPSITSVSPAIGAVTGGETLRIIGTRLDGVLSVTIGGVEVTGIRAISATEVEVTTPLHAPGTFDVVLRTSKGLGRLAKAFTFVATPGDITEPDCNGDGLIDARDIQIVLLVLLHLLTHLDDKQVLNADVNSDGMVNATDMQIVVNAVLRR